MLSTLKKHPTPLPLNIHGTNGGARKQRTAEDSEELEEEPGETEVPCFNHSPVRDGFGMRARRIIGSQVTGHLEIPEPCEKQSQTPSIGRSNDSQGDVFSLNF